MINEELRKELLRTTILEYNWGDERREYYIDNVTKIFDEMVIIDGRDDILKVDCMLSKPTSSFWWLMAHSIHSFDDLSKGRSDFGKLILYYRKDRSAFVLQKIFSKGGI